LVVKKKRVEIYIPFWYNEDFIVLRDVREPPMKRFVQRSLMVLVTAIIAFVSAGTMNIVPSLAATFHVATITQAAVPKNTVLVGNSSAISFGYMEPAFSPNGLPSYHAQKLVNGSWIDVPGSTSYYTQIGLRITIPASKIVETVTYRPASNTILGLPSQHGPTVQVETIDPNSADAMQKYMYKTIAPYCPGVAIVYRDTWRKNTVGEYSAGTNYITVKEDWAKVSGEINQAALALHECGHYVQYKVYKDNLTQLKHDAAQVFSLDKVDPIEHMADCMAQSVNPGGFMGYGGACSEQQLAVAKQVLMGERINPIPVRPFYR
jgi:hypothetical protein